MPGQGVPRQSAPETLGPFSGSPSESRMTGSIPNIGRCGFPGRKGAPGEEGLGAIATPPVSVCHQVSTRSHWPPPTTWWNHCHASWLSGSPTEPSTRKEERLCDFTHSSPNLNSSFADMVPCLILSPDEQPDGRGSSIEVGELMCSNSRPVAARVGVGWGRLKKKAGASVGQWPVHHIAGRNLQSQHWDGCKPTLTLPNI